MAEIPSVSLTVTGITFVAGSVFFTVAALTQWLLCGRPRFAGWRGGPASDWWSSAIQFAGTLCFNLSTTAALLQLTTVDGQPSYWRPDVYGSAAFLISSVMAFNACAMRDRLWDPEARVWRVAWFNLLGSVFFAISAIAARSEPGSVNSVNPTLDNVGTFVGALGFLIAALLMAPRPTTVRGE